VVSDDKTAGALALLLAIRDAQASRALDGETQHVGAPDGSCCWDHAMAKIAELEDANTRMRQRLEDVEALKADAVKLEEMTLLEGMWRKRVAELEAEVERLRSWLRECDAAIGGDGSDESLLGLVYTCGAGKDALERVGRNSGGGE